MESPWPRVYHTGRREFATVDMDMKSGPDTLFVIFEGFDDESYEVSTELLVPAALAPKEA